MNDDLNNIHLVSSVCLCCQWRKSAPAVSIDIPLWESQHRISVLRGAANENTRTWPSDCGGVPLVLHARTGVELGTPRHSGIDIQTGVVDLGSM